MTKNVKLKIEVEQIKKVIKCILIIIAILVILVSCYFIFFRSFKLSNHIAFRKVYSSEEDIDNIEITIIGYLNEELAKVTDKEDIKTIINTIKDEVLVNDVGLGETLLGKAYRFLIKNNKNGNEVKISLCGDQMSVNSKNFSLDKNLVIVLTDVYSKYHTF